MSSRFSRHLVRFCLAAAPFMAFAAEPLTLAEAQKQAVARSRQLAAQGASVQATREMAAAAERLPDPVLKAGVDNLPVSGPDRFSTGADFMTMRRLGVAVELTAADKRHWRAERLLRAGDKTRAESEVALAAIRRDTAIAWLERYFTEQMAQVLAAQLKQAKDELDAAEGAYRGGRGGQADLLAARASLGGVQDRADEIAAKVNSAAIMLARWTGDDGAAALGAAPDLDTLPLDPDRLHAELDHHPQVAVLRRQEEIAEADVHLAQLAKKSDWSVELAFQQRGPAYPNMVSVALSVPLQWDQKRRQDRELSASMRLAEAATAEREEAAREHTADTAAQMQQWQSGQRRIARYQRELLPLAAERVQASLAAYRGGKASLSEVLLARRAELDVRLQALQLQMDTARLWAALRFLLPEDHNTKSTGANRHEN